jgi:microcystin-dependent protein
MLTPTSLSIVQNQLAQFATQDDFATVITTAFGDQFDLGVLQDLRQQLLARDFSVIPNIEVLTNGELGGASGAYTAELDRIFLSSDFLATASDQSIAAVLLEEIGHRFDRLLNGSIDSPGDEGEIFSLLVNGISLPPEILTALQEEDDHAAITLGSGLSTNVEFSTVSTGVTGGSQPFNNIQPYGTLTYAIALQGVYPSRALSAEPQALTTGSFNPFVGEIIQFAGNFAPRGYALCEGQLLSISQNTALFSLLGTNYGGNGTTTFALPDLRGRTPIGIGTGPGLTTVNLGEKSGTETVTLTQAQLPTHTHSISGATTSPVGNNISHSTRQPTLGLSPIITTDGLFQDIGHIGWFAGNFAPVGHLFADGSLLSISQYATLFTLIGTTYGGDGQNTFALPDLRGRITVDDGSTHPIGSKFGSEGITLTMANLPSHTHSIPNSVTGASGGGQGFSNLQPSIALSYEIAIAGIYPTQNLQADTKTNNIDTGSSDVTGFVTSTQVLSETTAIKFINNLAKAGIERWQAAGIDATQIAQLEKVTYKIADLAPGYLAVFGADNVITIDADASNTKWFVDDTPSDNVEFGSTDPITGELLATDERALGAYDLLTTIEHEQGHVLGLAHTSQPGDIMFASLGKGGRLFPTATNIQRPIENDTTGTYFSAAESFIAQVGIFAGLNFGDLRRDFRDTNGQLLSIAQNQALFSLIGTNYGGNGTTNFALPNFRDRTVIDVGQGPGLANYSLGQTGGEENHTLTIPEMPAHSHEAAPIRNDFNNDKKADILWRNNDGTVALWQMNGANILAANIVFNTVDNTWKIAGTGDFDGDKKSDILWRNNNGQIVTWQMNGVAITSNGFLPTPTTDWKIAGTGDFNGDNKSDILWRNDSGAVSIWLMDGRAASFLAVVNPGNTWRIAGTGDFDGDSKFDVLWRKDDGQVVVRLMDGATTLSSTNLSAPVTADWKIKGVDDFDGDGKADILWRNDDGTVGLWQINGTVIALAQVITNVTNDWNIAGTGDYNGDGKSDILWRNNNGSNAIWFMNGAAISSGNYIASADSSWQIVAPTN